MGIQDDHDAEREAETVTAEYDPELAEAFCSPPEPEAEALEREAEQAEKDTRHELAEAERQHLGHELSVAEKQRAILMEVAERLVNRLAGEKMATGALLLPQAHAFIQAELGSIQQALDSANG